MTQPQYYPQQMPQPGQPPQVPQQAPPQQWQQQPPQEWSQQPSQQYAPPGPAYGQTQQNFGAWRREVGDQLKILPAGQHPMEISEATPGRTNDGNKDKITIKWRVISGPDQGKTCFDNQAISPCLLYTSDAADE